MTRLDLELNPLDNQGNLTNLTVGYLETSARFEEIIASAQATAFYSTIVSGLIEKNAYETLQGTNPEVIIYNHKGERIYTNVEGVAPFEEAVRRHTTIQNLSTADFLARSQEFLFPIEVKSSPRLEKKRQARSSYVREILDRSEELRIQILASLGITETLEIVDGVYIVPSYQRNLQYLSLDRDSACNPNNTYTPAALKYVGHTKFDPYDIERFILSQQIDTPLIATLLNDIRYLGNLFGITDLNAMTFLLSKHVATYDLVAKFGHNPRQLDILVQTPYTWSEVLQNISLAIIGMVSESENSNNEISAERFIRQNNECIHSLPNLIEFLAKNKTIWFDAINIKYRNRWKR
jgi:hypothetical protein